jgi:hypothetical protein
VQTSAHKSWKVRDVYDGELEINGVAGIEEAEPGQITFVANPRYATAAQRSDSPELKARNFAAFRPARGILSAAEHRKQESSWDGIEPDAPL